MSLETLRNNLQRKDAVCSLIHEDYNKRNASQFVYRTESCSRKQQTTKKKISDREMVSKALHDYAQQGVQPLQGGIRHENTTMEDQFINATILQCASDMLPTFIGSDAKRKYKTVKTRAYALTRRWLSTNQLSRIAKNISKQCVVQLLHLALSAFGARVQH